MLVDIQKKRLDWNIYEKVWRDEPVPPKEYLSGFNFLNKEVKFLDKMYRLIVCDDSSYIQKYFEPFANANQIIALDARDGIEKIFSDLTLIQVGDLQNNYTNKCKVIYYAHLLSSADRQLIASKSLVQGNLSANFLSIQHKKY